MTHPTHRNPISNGYTRTVADFLAAVGLILIGSIGACAAMLALGFRLPRQHESALRQAFADLSAELQAIRRLLQ